MNNKIFSLYATQTPEHIFKQLQTSTKGLTTQQAQERHKKNGSNELPQAPITWCTILKNQFLNPFMYLLFIIASMYLFTHEITESLIIFTIILINTGIGFYQEYQSNNAMKMLQSYLQTTQKTMRDGTITPILTNQLVLGDIIVLSTGDIIPADCRFIESENLVVDESRLTGESVPVQKTDELLKNNPTSLYEATNCGFTGTIITDGTAKAVVFAIGLSTALGSIATLSTQTITKSNLAQGTTQLARAMLILIMVSLTIIFLINLIIKNQHTSWLNLAFFSAALAITVIPTALPVVITFCLTKGAKILQKHKVIVKRLSAIEDLGNIEILCTDKTGTLTENSLSVKNIYKDDAQTLINAALTSIIIATKKENVPKGFEHAIMEKLTQEQNAQVNSYTIVKELPFSYDRHRSVTLAQKDHEYILITKGSAEYIIKKCPSLSSEEKTAIDQWVCGNEEQSNRVLAIASTHISNTDSAHIDITDEKITYQTIGLISFADPLTTTAAIAIKKAHALGITIKILSGDSAQICYAIAEQLGLENDPNNIVLGTTFEKSDEKTQRMLALNHTIFARITPEQKYKIISILQQHASVGYMGDGVNDAPALKMALVGIAVQNATPVAREAAEIILLQKSLLNVILAIEEGRTTIINIIKYIIITVTCNFGLFYSLALSSLFISYLPMLPLQLLLLDLLTDLPLISISTDKVHKEELKKPLHYNIKEISFVTLLFGLIITPFNFFLFTLFKNNPATLQTSWFITSALTQLTGL